ncbi:helix-turn-helix transcriptional regulator [Sphingopyxis macrogoltabida]|uniref:Phage transcriptional regulator, AlpA n=1 Tax=Sphingopyxis macrogoltabida TaxID=33050 RepID=A0AAC9AVD9_SPHMC|nr:hypothetical protein [Sphingopyxis macrogoltabida]ALJ12521.1 phage transcriptional regulator, AlpA [Sphingopyxis macrogoltabida]AMU90002.1 phage transcriptional regulator, AlpA [Sphingopyxis macrogoltabida]
MTISSKPWLGISPTGPLLRAKDAAEYVACSKAHFFTQIEKGILPPLIHIDPECRARGVPKPWLDAVIAERAAATLDASA